MRAVVVDPDIAASLVTACLVVSGDLDASELAAIHPAHFRWIADRLGDALDGAAPIVKPPRHRASRGLTLGGPPPPEE